MSERIVEVEWEDCSGRHGWMTPEELREYTSDREFIVTTLGYVQEDDKRGIVIVEALPADGVKKDGHRMVGCATFVPRSAIRKVTELARRKKR